MNITVLGSLESEDPKSYDVVVDQVAAALRKQKHRVSILGVHDDLRKLVSGFSRRKPDLVFNLVEMFGEYVRGDAAVAGVLDLLGLRYTGGGPGELYLRQDKGLAKKVLAFEKILYPDFAVFSQDADLETGGNLRMPLFVKPLTRRRLDRHRRRVAGPRHDLADEAGRPDPREGQGQRPGRGVHRGAGVLRRRPRQPRADRLPADRDGLLRPPRGASPTSPAPRPSGRRTASSTRGRSRSSPTSPTSCGPSSRRSPSTPTAPCASATTAGSTSA